MRHRPASRDARPGTRHIRHPPRLRPQHHAGRAGPLRHIFTHTARNEGRAQSRKTRHRAGARRHLHLHFRGIGRILPADTCGACGSRPADLQHLQPLARRDEPPAERPPLHLALRAHRAGTPEPAEGEHPRRAYCRHRQHRHRRPALGGNFGQSESPSVRTRREPSDGAHHRAPPRELRRRNGPYMPGNKHAGCAVPRRRLCLPHPPQPEHPQAGTRNRRWKPQEHIPDGAAQLPGIHRHDAAMHLGAD